MLFKKNPIDFIIVGLGNYGPKYDMTRHNAGFAAVDVLARKLGVEFTKSKFKALWAKCRIGDKKGLLVKPLTFMNLSGEAVRDISSYYKVAPENILVLFDDICLDIGKIRIRRKGSDGGHNGIKNISLYIGDDFPRVKIGVGQKPHPDYDLVDWVLSKIPKADLAPFNDSLERAADAAVTIISGDIDRAMCQYN